MHVVKLNKQPRMADEAGEEDMSDLDLPESSSGKQKRSTKAI